MGPLMYAYPLPCSSWRWWQSHPPVWKVFFLIWRHWTVARISVMTVTTCHQNPLKLNYFPSILWPESLLLMSYLQVKGSSATKYLYICNYHCRLCMLYVGCWAALRWYVMLIYNCSIDADCLQFFILPWTLCVANRKSPLQNHISVGCYLWTPPIMVYHLLPSNSNAGIEFTWLMPLWLTEVTWMGVACFWWC
jgi:hypothetical protein